MNTCLPLILLALLADQPTMAERFVPSVGGCQLILDGQGVKSVSLRGPAGDERTLLVDGPSLSLKPGQYRVMRIELKGGYSHYDFTGQESFTLRPDQPYHLRAGGPLSPHIDATRQGRLLKLDYRLLDAGGRDYRSENQNSPPGFTVLQGGREIASGKFAYG